MRSLLSQLLAVGPELAAFILTTPLLDTPFAHAIPASAPAPNLNLQQLGQVAVAGDFDSISLYSYQGQTEGSTTSNGSQSLFTRYPNGVFDNLGVVDANIMDMCSFVKRDGTFQGVVLCGNFTSVGGTPANSIALYNPNATNPVQALPGLSGRCNAVYCDQDASTVYVGGNFMGGNSTNALAWTTGWVNLPFAGFNGPVNSITKNAAGNIVFAGQFDGLGNSAGPKVPDQQVINLNGGNITTSGTTIQSGFSNATNIVCKTGVQAGSGNTWLLADNTAGWWQGQYGFGFIPTKLRLYNANQDSRGTKSFYFEDMNSGGILNMSYTDSTGTTQSCTNQCPLENNSTAQDFHFSPTVGMNSFRIYITGWYGAGGGLSGIELFQDEIYSFAINSYNEPQCDDVSLGSSSVVTPSDGTWVSVPLSGSADAADSGYLSANITSSAQANSGTNIVFRPDIPQSGNYSVTIWTPGCIQDNSCSTRGQVNVTAALASNGQKTSTTVYQTNNYGKFDQIYYGYVDSTSSFRPSVTLSPATGQQLPLNIVAQKVRFELITTTGGLNGLFEYNPNQATVDSDFSTSAIDSAGAALNSEASINAVTTYQNMVYAVGNFTSNGISNCMRIGTNAKSLPGGGLNGAVLNAFHASNDSILYLGGAFTNTMDSSVTGLNHVAAFSMADDKWSALGAGVDGQVSHVVPLNLNVSGSDAEECITISGNFTTVNAFAANSSFAASGFAVWVPKRNNWLHNLPDATIAVSGDLTSFATVPNSPEFYGGQVFTQNIGSSDAVALSNTGSTFSSLGVQLRANNASSSNSSSSLHKRDALSSFNQKYSGVYEGFYYNSNDNSLNITALGGSFSATASNGSTVENLVFVNNTGTQQTISGIASLDSDSIFMAMDAQNTSLFAGGLVGGSVNGNAVNGIIVYDLMGNRFASLQPPALTGPNVTVHAIRAQQDTGNVWVGGNFDAAGSLPCGTLCIYSTTSMSWNSPGPGLTGVINTMAWLSPTELLFAGNVSINGNMTTIGTYDTTKQAFSVYNGASALPGPVTALSTVMNNEFWVGGVATTNNSVYLSKYSGNTFTAASGLSTGTTIRGLQVVNTGSNHAGTALISSNQALLISGNIALPNTGNASAVIFNGTTYQPYILTSMADGSQGTLSGVFVEKPSGVMMNDNGHHLALGLVVLIGLAIALGLIFLLVIIGILVERQRRRNEGYIPMSSSRDGNLQRIPPSSLLAQLGEKGSPPRL